MLWLSFFLSGIDGRYPDYFGFFVFSVNEILFIFYCFYLGYEVGAPL